jgi:hypothetical protein
MRWTLARQGSKERISMLDLLTQAQTSEEHGEQGGDCRELLQSLLGQHDEYVAKQDWHGAYLATLGILDVVMQPRERQGVAFA